jgi:two-component system LytT family response regulator
MTATPIRVAIVDDEPLARRRLVRLLARGADLQLVGVYEQLVEAATNLRVTRPDLLLLDVRLRGQDGFELLRSVRAGAARPLVILVTAFADRAVEAFDVGAVDYLLKPFDDERFDAAIERARQRLATDGRSGADGGAARPVAPATPTAEAPRTSGERLLVRDGEAVRVLSLTDVESVHAEGRHVHVHAGGRAYLLRQTLHAVQRRLGEAGFVCVHRGLLINVAHVEMLQPGAHGDARVILRSGRPLPVSRRYRAALEARLVAP